MEIKVFNKQSHRGLAIKDMQKMAQSLGQEVLANLTDNKPIWLSAKTLSLVEKNATLSLIFVSKQTIKKLNKHWLTKNKETDVLSFPSLDLSSPESAKAIEAAQAAKKHAFIDISSDDQFYPLGEILIAYEKAQEQAKEYGHSLKREIAFLFVHGMLHIFGFDHQDQKSEQAMFARQRKILKKAGYPRSD